MIDPTIRGADAYDGDDIAQLQLLENEARSALAGGRGGNRWLAEHPPIGDGWAGECAEFDVLVAHIGAVVVGYIVAKLGEDGILRVDQLWVTPQARENGFGDALLAGAIDNARRNGAIAVEGQALPGDRQTKNLYERAGIVARLITTFRWL